jgi:sRNA-binding carbon storage regulator CsrA
LHRDPVQQITLIRVRGQQWRININTAKHLKVAVFKARELKLADFT